MSTIVLNSLNYVGGNVLNGVSWFRNTVGGLASAFSTLTARVNLTNTHSNVLWKLVVPIVKGEDSACGCAGDVVRTTNLDISIRFDRAATAAERADVLARVRDLVASSQFGESLSSLNTPT